MRARIGDNVRLVLFAGKGIEAMEETTLIICKPDAVQRGLMGRIIGRFEDKGLKLAGAKLIHIDEKLASQHYAEHVGKPFYDGLVKYITSTPVMVLAIRGNQAVTVARKMVGATKGFEADPGTIRGDYSTSRSYNLVHGSDSPESAKREVALFFKDDELHDYRRDIDAWLNAADD
jgi:nucleoside-diphosphate kinase